VTLTGYTFLGGAMSLPDAVEGKLVLTRVNDPSLGNRFLGSWIGDRPDTEQDEKHFIKFNENGKFDDSATDTFDKQWFCTDGVLYIVNRSNDMDNDKSHVTPLVPTFDDSDSVVTLSAPDGSPRMRLARMSDGRG
jgi:hypothetical protein